MGRIDFATQVKKIGGIKKIPAGMLPGLRKAYACYGKIPSSA